MKKYEDLLNQEQDTDLLITLLSTKATFYFDICTEALEAKNYTVACRYLTRIYDLVKVVFISYLF